ncbi:MAG: PorT family protein [Acidobacteria bacterium]|nr:PorT family protein [Acidobacteriota bacterium]
MASRRKVATQKRPERGWRRSVLLCLFLVATLTTPALAQELHFGLKAGVPVTSYFETRTSYSSATRRYTVGLSAEWLFKNGIGLEFDGLYKRIGYVGRTTFRRIPFDGVTTTTTFDVKGNSWDFPVLVKYRFRRFRRLYVTGGGVIRYIVSVRARGQTTVEDLIARTTVSLPFDSTDPFDLRKRVYPGVTVGGGYEFTRGRLRVLPEFRYTRWTANISAPNLGQVRLNPNQAEFLLGILF